MDNVLIVTSSDSSRVFLENFLKDGFTQAITCADSSAQARRILSERDFEVVVINVPLSDEMGLDLAFHASENTVSGIILLVKNEIEEETAETVGVAGVLTVSKPVHKNLIAQALRLAAASHARLSGFQDKVETLEKRIEEIRIIDRAKYALIQYLGMSESDAHRYIEKQAMDRRISKRSVAGEILQQYS